MMSSGRPLGRAFVISMIRFHATGESIEKLSLGRGCGSLLIKALSQQSTALDVVHILRLDLKANRFLDIWRSFNVFPLHSVIKATAREDALSAYWIREAVGLLLNMGCDFHQEDPSGTTAADLLPSRGDFVEQWQQLQFYLETSSGLTPAAYDLETTGSTVQNVVKLATLTANTVLKLKL